MEKKKKRIKSEGVTGSSGAGWGGDEPRRLRSKSVSPKGEKKGTRLTRLPDM